MGGIDSIGNLTSMDMHGTSITRVSDLISCPRQKERKCQSVGF